MNDLFGGLFGLESGDLFDLNGGGNLFGFLKACLTVTDANVYSATNANEAVYDASPIDAAVYSATISEITCC